MKARALILFSLIVLLAFFARAEVEWSAKVDFEALFPSYIISTATIQQPKANTDVAYLRDKNGQVGCEVISPEDDCLFKVEISSSKFIKISILEGRLPKAGRKYRIYPSLEYDFDALYKVIEPVPETVSVRLELAGKSVGIKKKDSSGSLSSGLCVCR